MPDRLSVHTAERSSLEDRRRTSWHSLSPEVDPYKSLR